MPAVKATLDERVTSLRNLLGQNRGCNRMLPATPHGFGFQAALRIGRGGVRERDLARGIEAEQSDGAPDVSDVGYKPEFGRIHALQQARSESGVTSDQVRHFVGIHGGVRKQAQQLSRHGRKGWHLFQACGDGRS